MFDKTKKRLDELEENYRNIVLRAIELELNRVADDEIRKNQDKNIEALKELLACLMDYYIMFPNESIRLKHCLDNGYQLIQSGSDLITVVRNKKPHPLKDKPKSKAKKRS